MYQHKNYCPFLASLNNTRTEVPTSACRLRWTSVTQSYARALKFDQSPGSFHEMPWDSWYERIVPFFSHTTNNQMPDVLSFLFEHALLSDLS